ncbi:type I-F CRISPR-associated protein Csy3 [Photobacterium damselae]|uniref:type I-F CRISPR-associated protein Csy3 n=1 Tax=Photobacterium damselae TaxID=38293 RepID=UPI0040680925
MAKAPSKKTSGNIYPTNLGFSKSITPSVGVLRSYSSKNPADIKLLNITEVTSVGTISNYKDVVKDGGKNVEQSNPQTVDVCFVPITHDSISLEFTVSFCCNSKTPHACNEKWFTDAIRSLTGRYDEIGGYEYLADLYLKNIFAAKMLWRNGFAEDVVVSVEAMRTDIGEVTDIDSDNYKLLVERVGLALKDATKRVVLEVKITGWIGRGQEVYPSQEFVEKGTGKGAKSKTLARTEVGQDKNVAAMHSQKIGNAVRQIDVWYDGFAEKNKALAIDPACVDKSEMRAYRLKETKRDLFTLLEKRLLEFEEQIKTQSLDEINVDIHFIIANLIRGGVFGGTK